MPKEQLGRLLEDLAAQLETADTLDEGERAALEHLQLRIAAALAEEEQPEDMPGEAIGDLVDRFESSHPTLTMTLGRIMDALNKLGI
jgi:DNA-binding MarR family transcriptional regulator